MNRQLENIIRFLLDECTPPLLRDTKLFMRIPFFIAFGKKGKLYWDFKDKSPRINDQEMAAICRYSKDVKIQDGATDLSPKMIEKIRETSIGNILDAGCGNGILLEELSKDHKTAGCDYIIEEATYERCSESDLKECSVENLPWSDSFFDTVVSTHVLEHVQNPMKVLHEFDRVSKNKIIIVLPKERPYKFTFNLHLHFFPYKYTVVHMLQWALANYIWEVEEIEGAWFCQTNKSIK